jgi:dUTP pyrophosphatase
MKIKVKKLNPNAVIPYKSHDNDFCYDCVATSCEEIAPNVYKYGLGLAFEIVREDDADDFVLDIDARPRSSVWKTGMVLSNCVGTIDEPYRGEVAAIFYHVMPDMPKYEVGDRIVQISIGITSQIEFEEVDELSQTERGAGGFGSTGK